MLFMLPGLVLWITGAIWCFRNNNIRGSIVFQIVGALEILIGGIFALIMVIKSDLSDMMAAGGYDTYFMSRDFVDYCEIPIIGLIAHFILLAFTLILAIRAKRNLRK